MEETAVFATEGHPSLLASGLQSLRQSNDLCDVVIVVDGHRFPAHRNVLASFSDYFRTMFLREFAERRQTEITLQNVDAASVKTLIDYAYTGKAEIAVDDVERLYASAHFLQFNDIVTKCGEWLRNHTDPSNCFHLGVFADQYDDSLLMSVSDRVAAVNIVEVASTDEFLALSAEQLCRIAALDELGVKDENDVLHLLHKWIKHDYELRKKHIKCEALLRELQIGDWVTERVAEDTIEVGTVSPRTGCQDVLLVVGGEVYETDVIDCDYEWTYNLSKKARYYDPSQDVWASFPSLVEWRCYPGLVTVDDVLYAVGGETFDPMRYTSGDKPLESVYSLKTVERYDSKQKQWVADVEPMSHPRCGDEVTSCLGRIFGITESNYKWLVEAYSPEKNKWFPISSPSGRVCCRELAAFSDQVYVFTWAYDDFGYIRYDPIEDRWQDFSPAPFSLGKLSELTMTTSDTIYFFSGSFSSSSICASFFKQKRTVVKAFTQF
ncbi:kelch-like protein 20 [Oscarella lobularis]|uniref:kelch-like protein 20 n=1 Tax=Oscarella lobularis TaxID=121494 RepID=UPI003313877A